MKENNCRNDSRSVHWVGVDVAKDTFEAALVRCSQHYPDTPLREIPVCAFARSSNGVQALLAWLNEHGVDQEHVRVVMEATGNYSTELAVWMLSQRQTLSPAIANPRQTNAFIKSMAVRNKTDSLDARALGFYGVERHPAPYEPLSPEQAELRALSRYRGSLIRQRSAVKNQIKETCECAFVQKIQLKRLRLLTGDIGRVVEQMKALVAQHDVLKHDVELLISIYGVAFINATTILAELGDLRRFTLARQLSAFAGMSPRHHQSGTSIRGRSRLCKQGNPRVRQCLYLCALTAIRGNNQFRETYQRLLAQGKPPMVAVGAIMRKLLVLMRAILISGKRFQPLGISG